MSQFIQNIQAYLTQEKGFKFFINGDYNLNIIAIREDDIFDNRFTDTLVVAYKVNGFWQFLKIKWTTLAGLYGFGGEQNPLTKWQTGTDLDGVAIISDEYQYLGAFEYVNKPKQPYPFKEYLEQIKPLNYWRDNNRNGKIDRTQETFRTGNYKTHIHAMSPKGTDGEYIGFVGSMPWSQGCQGTPDIHFQKFMDLIKKAIPIWGTKFSYTVIRRDKFVEFLNKTKLPQ